MYHLVTGACGYVGSNIVEIISFQPGGKIGIGSASPSAKFVVSNDGANGFEFNPNFNSNNSIIASYNRSGGGSYSQLTLSASQHIFAQGGTEYGRFNASGRLGIGTSIPDQKLTVAADSASAIIELKRTNTNTTGSFGALSWTAMDGHSVANMYALGDGDNEGAHLVFRTTSAAASNDPYNAATVERLRIDSSGRLLTGGATSSQGSTNSDDLQIGANDQANQTGITLGSASASGIRFADAASDTAGAISYYHSDDTMRFTTGATGEKLRITSNGNVDINGTQPWTCLLYTSPSQRDATLNRMTTSA